MQTCDRRCEAEAETQTRAGQDLRLRRTNRSTTRARSASGMPGPRSATVRTTRSPVRRAPTTISAGGFSPEPSAAGRAYLIALSTRLASAWLSSSRLPFSVAGSGASARSARPFSSASGS